MLGHQSMSDANMKGILHPQGTSDANMKGMFCPQDMNDADIEGMLACQSDLYMISNKEHLFRPLIEVRRDSCGHEGT